MSKDAKAEKAAEQAEDRKRMSRIVKKHEAAKKKATRREDVNQAAALIVRKATE